MLPSQIPLCAELQQRSRPLGARITLILLDRRVLVLPVTGPTPNCPQLPPAAQSVGLPIPREGARWLILRQVEAGEERASDVIETIKL